MQSLTFTNSKGQSMTIGYSRPISFSNLLGLSGAPVSLYSSKGYLQDGQTDEGQDLEARPVSFTVRVMADTLKDIFQYRRQLVAFMNPKGTYTVTYQNDYMSLKFTCRIHLAPDFKSTNKSAIMAQECDVGLTCDDPYLYDIDETSVRMSISEPLLAFPLCFPTGGIPISTLSNKRAVVTITGDVPAPVRIQFVGGSVNPIITNVTTGEFIKVNHTIVSTEILEITTAYGQKRVWIIAEDGTRTDAFSYIDNDSTFFELAEGENELLYDADSGADSASVFIYYSNKYVGV